MNGGGGAAHNNNNNNNPSSSSSSSSDGEFLLSLLRNLHNNHPNNNHQQQQQPHHFDPAVSAVGPSIPIPFPHLLNSSNSQNPNLFSQNTLSPPPPTTITWPHHLSPSQHRTPPFHTAPHHHFRQALGNNSNVLFGGNNGSNVAKDSNFDQGFDLFKDSRMGFNLGSGSRNGFESDRRIDPRLNRVNPPPPGFSGNSNSNRMGGNNVGMSRNFQGNNYEKERRFSRQERGGGGGGGLSGQVENPGLPSGSACSSVLGSDVERSMKVLHGGEVDNEVVRDEVDELSERLVDSVLDDEGNDEKGELNGKKKHPRDKVVF